MVRLERVQHPGAVHPSLWRRGFLSNRQYLYPGVATSRDLYISDLAIESRMRWVNSSTALSLLGDKVVFADALRARGLADRAPQVLGSLVAGRFRPRTADGVARLRTDAVVVVKPVAGRSGTGVQVVTGTQVLTPDAFPGADLVVQQHVRGAEPWSQVNPASLNTVRVVVVRTPGDEVVIVGAVHRFGTVATGAVDNVSAGGICSRVDLDSGRLSPAVGLPRDRRRDELVHHPDTGRRIAGEVVPQWPELRDLALELMNAFPEADHVGWDLCPSDSGPLVVEGNAEAPNLNVLQFHGSVLGDERVRDFYARHGMEAS